MYWGFIQNGNLAMILCDLIGKSYFFPLVLPFSHGISSDYPYTEQDNQMPLYLVELPYSC